MIVLTGTSGRLGGGVLQKILKDKIIPLKEIIISISDTKKVPSSVKELGITVRHGDMKNPETLVKSYTGAQTFFLVSFPSISEERFGYHKAAIDAAVEAGITHITYTSLSFGGATGLETVAGVMKAHVDTVKYIMSTGLSYTILEPGDRDIDIVIPGDGPNSWASRDELAEATGVIVENWRDYRNQSVLLTGPRTTSIREIGALLETYTRRKVNVKVVSKHEAIAYHKMKGSLPAGQDWYYENWASWHQGMENGEVNIVDPLMEKLLERKPRGIEEMQNELFGKAVDKVDTKEFDNYAK